VAGYPNISVPAGYVFGLPVGISFMGRAYSEPTLIRLAFAFRQAFHKDVVVDMICYRRYGHNEADEPAFTQPRMYELIDGHPSPRTRYTETLVRRGDMTMQEAEDVIANFRARLDVAFEETHASAPPEVAGLQRCILRPALLLPEVFTLGFEQLGRVAVGQHGTVLRNAVGGALGLLRERQPGGCQRGGHHRQGLHRSFHGFVSSASGPACGSGAGLRTPRLRRCVCRPCCRPR
jgi:hypothetical protein